MYQFAKLVIGQNLMAFDPGAGIVSTFFGLFNG
jgi:hypothetical protein